MNWEWCGSLDPLDQGSPTPFLQSLTLQESILVPRGIYDHGSYLSSAETAFFFLNQIVAEADLEPKISSSSFIRAPCTVLATWV